MCNSACGQLRAAQPWSVQCWCYGCSREGSFVGVLQHGLCPDISATQGLQRALQLLQVAVSTGGFNFCSLLLQNRAPLKASLKRGTNAISNRRGEGQP